VGSSDTFVDEVQLTVSSGDGGNGCVSYRREKFVPLGGSDGGDGGRGGDAIFVANRNLNTLLMFRHRREFGASRGRDGGGQRKTGANGQDVVIRVPVGTAIYPEPAADDAEPLADLSEDGQTFAVARGGRGGRGNARFKTPTRQTPDFAQSGAPGQTLQLRLSLKLLADVGLVGFPNAGKSTLLSRISAARPRAAAYPFTTLTPSLGVVERGDRRFVVADIPGLIEGASQGAGLGDRFLRHIERTSVLVHLLDLGSMLWEDRDLLADYETLRHELRSYQPQLAERAEIVVLNKIDLMTDRTRLEDIEAGLRQTGRPVLRASGVSGEGIEELIAAMERALADIS
jgi:GTP-binding protein